MMKLNVREENTILSVLHLYIIELKYWVDGEGIICDEKLIEALM